MPANQVLWSHSKNLKKTYKKSNFNLFLNIEIKKKKKKVREPIP